MPATTPAAGTKQPQPAGAWVTQQEAAALCGLSYDTIRRRRRNGRLPRSRERADGSVELPVADLVAAGLLDPTAAGADVGEIATRSRAERDLTAARQDLAVLAAKLDAAIERAERAEDLLRSLIAIQGRAV